MRDSSNSLSRFYRTIQYSGGLASIISLPVSLVGTIGATWIYNLIVPNERQVAELSQVAIILTVFATVSLIISSLILSQAARTKDELLVDAEQLRRIRTDLDGQDDIYSMIEAISHEQGDNSRRIAARIRTMSLENYNRQEIQKRIISNWRKYSQSFVDNSREIFQTLTGSNCSVCIKILGWPLNSGREPTVETLIRDGISRRHREFADKINARYSAASNTAFNRIMHDTTFDTVFACNDLASSETYLNMNEDWREYYNSTLVCPIGSEHFKLEEDGHDEPFGYDAIAFFCVDSPDADLESKRCVFVGKILSQVYNEYINYIARLYFEFDDIERASLLLDSEAGFENKLLRLSQQELTQPHRNRSLGLRILREFDAEGKASGTYFDRTPMIIYRLFRKWRDSSIA